jgi:quinol monooxygenase YgiN
MTDTTPMITVAVLEPQPDQVAAVEDALRAAVRAAHSEAGCQRYALHRTADEPVRFVMVEQWADADALAAHMTGDGIAALRPVLATLLAAPPQILRLTALPDGDAKLGQIVA